MSVSLLACLKAFLPFKRTKPKKKKKKFRNRERERERGRDRPEFVLSKQK